MAEHADFVAPSGGISTKEAGAVTGDLTLVTEHSEASTVVRVKYRGSQDEYEVVGSPVSGQHAPQDVATWLTSRQPTTDSLGNESPVDVRDLWSG